MHNFSQDEISKIAEMERHMDAGKIPFVMLPGFGRVSTSEETMKELGLVQGQTINPVIFGAILQMSLAQCETKVILQKASKTKENPHG